MGKGRGQSWYIWEAEKGKPNGLGICVPQQNGHQGQEGPHSRFFWAERDADWREGRMCFPWDWVKEVGDRLQSCYSYSELSCQLVYVPGFK
jgi:hypothetical protein